MRSTSGRRRRRQFKNSFSPVTSTHVLSPSSAASQSLKNRSTIYHLMQEIFAMFKCTGGNLREVFAEKEKLRNMFKLKQKKHLHTLLFLSLKTALILGRVGDHYPPQIFLHFNHFYNFWYFFLFSSHLACAHRIVNLKANVHNAIHRRDEERFEDNEEEGIWVYWKWRLLIKSFHFHFFFWSSNVLSKEKWSRGWDLILHFDRLFPPGVLLHSLQVGRWYSMLPHTMTFFFLQRNPDSQVKKIKKQEEK